MALLRENQIALVSNTDTMEFKPNDGESVVIKGIYAIPTSPNPIGVLNSLFLSVIVNKTSIGYIPIEIASIPMNRISDVNSDFDMWKWAKINGFNFNIPVGDGQKLVISGTNLKDFSTFELAWIYIIYDVYSGKDITGVEDNGAFASNNTYFNILTIGEEITEKGIYEFDKTYLPAEFVAFPVEPVPAKTEIDVLAMIGITAGNQVDTTDWLNTEYLRLFHRREVLFDRDRNGFIFDGGQNPNGLSEINNVLNFAPSENKWGKVLKPKITFEANEELTIQAIVDGDGTATIPADSIGLIMLLNIRNIKA